MQKTWEDFAAFCDLAELETVCEHIDEDVAAVKMGADLSGMAGENAYLRRQLEKQDIASSDLLETEKPGLYARTWMAALFSEVYQQLDDMSEQPMTAAAVLQGLKLNLYKVLIAAHEVFDPSHRAALVAKALADGEGKGEAKVKAARSIQQAKAVKSRGDQVEKEKFCAWLKCHLDAGVVVINYREILALEGAEKKWNDREGTTLMAWAKSLNHSNVQPKSGRSVKKTEKKKQ